MQSFKNVFVFYLKRGVEERGQHRKFPQVDFFLFFLDYAGAKDGSW